MKRKRMAAIVILLVGIWLLATAASGQQFIRIQLDGSELETEVAPVIVDGRTLVPLRVISENLGAGVLWNSETRTVEITSPGRQFMDGYAKKQMYVMQAEEVKPLFEAGGMNILDVRPLEAYESSFIRGSIHIPMPELLDRMTEIPADKPIAVFCSKNINAAYAVMLLNMAGVEAYLMEGGIEAWKGAGGVTSSCRT